MNDESLGVAHLHPDYSRQMADFRNVVFESVRAYVQHVDRYLAAIYNKKSDHEIQVRRMRAAAAIRCAIAVVREWDLGDVRGLVEDMSKPEVFDDTSELNSCVLRLERMCNEADAKLPGYRRSRIVS
jgi:hypothetical protein